MEKPTGVYIMGALLIISSLIGVVIGLRGLSVDIPSVGRLVLDPSTPMFLVVTIVSATVLVLSIIGLVAAVGLFFFKNWARTTAVIVAAISLFLDVFFFASGGFGLAGSSGFFAFVGRFGGITAAIFNLVLWIYLTRDGVKRAFE